MSHITYTYIYIHKYADTVIILNLVHRQVTKYFEGQILQKITKKPILKHIIIQLNYLIKHSKHNSF